MEDKEVFNISSSINSLQRKPKKVENNSDNVNLDPFNRDKQYGILNEIFLSEDNDKANVEQFSSTEPTATLDNFGQVDSPSDNSEMRKKSRVKRSAISSFTIAKCRIDYIATKIFYFSFLGALGVVLPFTSVFLKQLGLNAFQIGLISGIRPVIGFLSGPLWGCIADRFRIRRLLVIISVIAWLGFFVGLYFIPHPTRVTSCPDVSSRSRLHVRAAPDDISTTEKPDHNGLGLKSNDSLKNVAGLKEDISWLYEPDDVYKIFIICLLVICGGEFFQSPTTALQDAATLEMLGREGLHRYGAQRAWGTVGWALCSLLAGLALNQGRQKEVLCGVDVSTSDYRVLAYIFIGVMIIAIAAVLKLDLSNDHDTSLSVQHEGDQPVARSTACDILKLFLTVHYGSWILTTFFVGVSSGVIWGFLFWHLDNLGGTQLLMGVDSMIACSIEVIAFLLVDRVIKIVGHIGVLYIGLVGYIIRFTAYASLTNPWFVLPADALHGITFAFVWASLTSYSALAIPAASLSTIQGIIHGVYFGLGNGVGHFLGGIFMGRFGAVITFYGMAVACSIWLLLFILCQRLSSKPSNQFDYRDMDIEGTYRRKTDD